MEAETNSIECEQREAETELEMQTRAKEGGKVKLEERGEIRFFGVRTLMINPISACEKIDRMFGTGGEAIVHYMWFESGNSLFDSMIKCNPSKSLEELLKALVNAEPRAGWGNVSLRIIHNNPPMVDIVVENPPVKTVKGSQKQLIGSFWAGVLSRHFNRQLVCKNFSYNADRDEFACTVTI